MVRASRRVLRVLRMAPAIGTAKWSSYMAGILGAKIETTWPLFRPMDDRDEASWRHRRWVWDQV